MSRDRLTLLLLSLILAVSAHAQLDPTFGNGGLTKVALPGNDWPVANFPQLNGKVLSVVLGNDLSTYHLFRFENNGVPDATFGVNGRVTLSIPFNSPTFHYLQFASMQMDGKVLLYGVDGDDSMIVRINENGTLDTTFSGDGIDRPNLNPAGRDYIISVIPQPDGKLVAGVNFTSPQRFLTIRYDANGVLDPAVGPAHTGEIWSMGMQAGGKVLVFDTSRFVYRLNADGSQDNSFATPATPNTNEFLVLTNDKFIVAGWEFVGDTMLRRDMDMLLRGYNADGSPDTAFGNNGTLRVDVAGGMRDEVKKLTQAPNGDVIVAAKTVVEVNRTSFKNNQLSLVRISLAGVVKGKYLVTEADAEFAHISTQPDGKIVALSTIAGDGRDVFVTRVVNVPLIKYRFHGIPYQFGSNLHAGPAVFRASQNRWFVGYSEAEEFIFGSAGDIPVPSDYLGDYTSQLSSELAVFTPSTGTWRILPNPHSFPLLSISVRWGMNGDIPVPADYDGDGKSDIAVFRPSDGVWYIRNGSDESFRFEHWGLGGDRPVAGDYDGDGIYDVAVWRPSNGVWYILRSSDRQAEFVHFGTNGDIPVHEDFDGDGKFDVAVWRPSSGMWYIRRSSDGGFTYFNWGTQGDVPVPADYDADHKIDIAVFRPSTRVWYIVYSGGQPSDPFAFGAPGDVPLAGRQ